MHIIPFAEQHIEDAAALVARRYTHLRAVIPWMPERYEQPAALYSPLHNLTQQHPGVTAIDGRQLMGFLSGMTLPGFRGRRSVYSPEWGNAAIEEHAYEIYQRLYTELSNTWVSEGCSAHYVTVFAHDKAGIDAWFRQSFGMMSVDAMRDTSPAINKTIEAKIETKLATRDDIDTLRSLDVALRDYIQSAPIFLMADHIRDRTAWEKYLQDEQNRVWLASCDGEYVAFMQMGPANPDVCYVIRDPKTVSITAAFTEETYRAQGAATILLNQALDWARQHGYTRCAVDFESMNLPGARFWLRHFQPFCYSMQRVIDDRLMPPAR